MKANREKLWFNWFVMNVVYVTVFGTFIISVLFIVQNVHSVKNTDGEILDKAPLNTDKILENSAVEKSDKFLYNQIDQTGELMSSTLVITRRYQRKRQCIISRTGSMRQVIV